MGVPAMDITDHVYGRLTVVEKTEETNRQGKALWLCRCDCGNAVKVCTHRLRHGNTRSCGCLHRDVMRAGVTRKHGHRRPTPSSTYRSWQSMRARCTNPKNSNYRYYGARGIRVCERWLNSFEAFLEDMGEKPVDGWHIDRTDPSGDYEPGNCQWVSPEVNIARRNGTA